MYGRLNSPNRDDKLTYNYELDKYKYNLNLSLISGKKTTRVIKVDNLKCLYYPQLLVSPLSIDLRINSKGDYLLANNRQILNFIATKMSKQLG